MHTTEPPVDPPEGPGPERSAAAAVALDNFGLAMRDAATGMAVVAPDGKFLEVNRSLGEMLGRSPEDLTRTTWQALTHPDDLQQDVDLVAELHAGRRDMFRTRKRYIHADGHLIWGELTVSAVRDSDGRVVTTIAQIIDVTGQVQAERALARAEERYRLVADHASDVIFLVGPDGTYEWVSPSISEVLGWDPTDALGRSFVDFVHPDDVPRLREARAHAVNGLSQMEDLRFRRPDGAYLWMSGRARQLDDDDGNLAARVVALRDVHEQVRAQQALRRSLAQQALLSTAIDQAAEAVLVTDPTPTILYANPAALRSSGYTEAEVLGQNPRIFRSGLHDRVFYDTMWAQLRGGRSWHGVLLDRRKDGELYEEDTTIAPVHDEAGSLIAYVAVKHDLTTERRLEADRDRDRGDREAVVEVMRRVAPGDSMETTAAALCRAITDLTDLDIARVVLVDHAGDLLLVGSVGDHQLLGWQVGQSRHLGSGDAIIGRTATGTWWSPPDDPSAPFTPEIAAAMTAAGYTAVAVSPIRWGGELIGALMVGSESPDAPGWMDARLPAVEELGSFAGTLLGAQAERYGRLESRRAEVRAIIDHEQFHPVFQPVIELASGVVQGYEALTRFADGRRPDLHFAEAAEIGLGAELEAACVRVALEHATSLPPQVWLSVNFSPTAIIDGHAAQVLADAPRPIVVEITEHDEIQSYPMLRHAIAACGPVRTSVDDAGSGFASLRHILELQPDIVKLDIALVTGIDQDPARQALAAGLVHYAAQTGTVLIAEGVETQGESDTVQALGVELAQGYLYGRPEPRP